MDIEKYLEYNDIPYESWDEYIFAGSKSTLVMPKGNFLMILPPAVLYDLDLDLFRKHVEATNGIFYFAQSMDNTGMFYESDVGNHGIAYADFLNSLDAEIYFHLDSIPEVDDPRVVTTNHFFLGKMSYQPKLKNTFVRDKDFLLLTILKKSRPHRQQFVQQAKSANLLENYLGNITDHTDTQNVLRNAMRKHANIVKNNPLSATANPGVVGDIGKKTYVSGLSESVPASIIPWDLYYQVHYEVVLETYFDRFTYFTEKTLRPICAEVPFVSITNQQNYAHLHSYEFETFGDIIDESFAYESDLGTRIKKLVTSMQDINPKEFYALSREKCAHNYNNLCIQYAKDYRRLFEDLDVFFEKIGLTK